MKHCHYILQSNDKEELCRFADVLSNKTGLHFYVLNFDGIFQLLILDYMIKKDVRNLIVRSPLYWEAKGNYVHQSKVNIKKGEKNGK